MSGIFVIAPLLAFLATLLLWAMIRIAVWWCGNGSQLRAIGRATALISFPLFCVILFLWLPAVMTNSGIGVTARIANERLLTISVPETALEVDYRSAIFSGLTDAADFTVDEAAFLEWMSGNEWTPASFFSDETGIHWTRDNRFSSLDIVSVTPVKVMLEGRGGDLDVRNGYYFDDYDKSSSDDSGLTVVYDSDRHRAYVWRTTF